MATPGSVVKCIAKIFEAPVGGVTEIDRALIEAGGREKGGRGRSAIRLGPRDVANLLITTAASPLWGPTITRARDTYLTYTSLPLQSGPITRDVGLTALQNLPEDHTICDAVATLVASAVSGELQMALDEHVAHSSTAPILLIGFCSPVPSARIKIRMRKQTLHLDYRKEPTSSAYNDSWTSPPNMSTGDLSQFREFSYRTLLALGDLLAGRVALPREVA